MTSLYANKDKSSENVGVKSRFAAFSDLFSLYVPEIFEIFMGSKARVMTKTSFSKKMDQYLSCIFMSLHM